jgi:hypothetical protein
VRLCLRVFPMYARGPSPVAEVVYQRPPPSKEQSLSNDHGPPTSLETTHRLQQIRQRLVEARRELDALIGDAYLRPRANIVPVHFLDLASAVEKLRWAEKEWRELDDAARDASPEHRVDAAGSPPARSQPLVEVGRAQSSAR